VGNLAEARSWLTQAIAMAGEKEPQLRAKALHHLGNITLDMGDFPASRESFEAGYQLVASGDDPITLARAFNGLGLVNYFQGNLAEAKRFHEQALAIRRDANDRIGIGLSHSNLGDVALALGNIDEARTHHEAALRLRQALQNRLSTGYSILNLGTVALVDGALERARMLLNDALEIMQTSTDRAGTAYVLVALGRVYRELQDPVKAADYARQSLEIRTSIGDLWGTIDSIDEIATIAACADRMVPAIELFSATSKQREQMTAPLLPIEQETRDKLLRSITETLGEQQVRDHAYAGTLFSMTQATNEAMDLACAIASQPGNTSAPTPAGTASPSVLSPREFEVLRLAAQGLTDQQIADALFMSRRTATTHQANIRQKLGVQNRAEAVAYASREGLL
jgi:non-specific serine/threonine protein kinase